jgi:hypothetical protein
MPVPGKEDEYNTYKKMSSLRTVAMVVLILQIIFSKPQWCREKGQNIDVGSQSARKNARRTLTT